MTTVDLLQRYLSFHEYPVHIGRVSQQLKASNSENPDPTMPESNPSQYFDAKTKILHDMLEKAVKDIADNQSEPASEYEGTLWRSPLQPRSRSPTCSEISDSFESPGRIEHCTKELLSTPISPTSTQFKGPDGWPLGIEVAMNDFHSGRLSTPVLQKEELPNRLILRKQQQQTPRFGSNGNGEEQKNASYVSVPFERQCDDQHHQQSVDLKTLALRQRQSCVLSQQYFERQDHADGASLEPLTFQQQSSSRRQQQSDRRWEQDNVDHFLGEMQDSSDEKYRSNVLYIPTLSARKFGDDEKSRGNHASTDLDLNLENTELEKFSGSQPYKEALDESYPQIDGISLICEDNWPPVLSNSLPCNDETNENAHHLVSQVNAPADALDTRIYSPKLLGVFEGIGVESIDPALGCKNTFEDIGNDSFQDDRPLTSEDGKADTDSDIVAWKTLGILDNIPEESEDALTIPLTLNRGQPQHFILKTADLQKSSGGDDRRDSMLAPDGLSTKPSRRRLVDGESFEPLLSAPTKAEFQDLILTEGHLSAATLAELRKIAESQPHFQNRPDSLEDQFQAEIHPVLRSKSFSRPFYQPTTMINDPALKYVFEDDDSEGHAAGGDSVSHQINMSPSLFQAEAQDNDSFAMHTSMEEHPSSQLGKMMGDTVPRCKEVTIKGREGEYAGTSKPQSMLVPSLGNANPSSSSMYSTSSSSMDDLSVSASGSPDMMPSSIFEPSSSPANTIYYSNLTTASPAAYNSWASDSDYHSPGNSWSTPSSGTTVPTSAIPTPNAPLYDNVSQSHGMNMTPSSSFGQCIETSPSPMTPSSSFGEITDNKPSRHSVSFSSMFSRYHKARYPALPTAAMTDSTVASNQSAERVQARGPTNDPFTSVHNGATQFSLALKAPSKDDLAEPLNLDVGILNSPTKRSSGRFSMHRRSLSASGRPKTNEGIENALSSLLFNPHRSFRLKRRHSASASIDSTAEPEGGDLEHRRSLSIASDTVEQKWEVAPPSTPLDLRDEYSMRYRPEAVEANEDYFSRKDALQGVKQGWKKVFGHK